MELGFRELHRKKNRPRVVKRETDGYFNIRQRGGSQFKASEMSASPGKSSNHSVPANAQLELGSVWEAAMVILQHLCRILRYSFIFEKLSACVLCMRFAHDLIPNGRDSNADSNAN